MTKEAWGEKVRGFGEKEARIEARIGIPHFLVKRIEGGELEFRKLPTPGPRRRMEFTVEKKLIEDFRFFLANKIQLM